MGTNRNRKVEPSKNTDLTNRCNIDVDHVIDELQIQESLDYKPNVKNIILADKSKIQNDNSHINYYYNVGV